MYELCTATIVNQYSIVLTFIGTDLDVEPAPVRTQTCPQKGRSLHLIVIDAQGLQTERWTVCNRNTQSSHNKDTALHSNALMFKLGLRCELGLG